MMATISKTARGIAFAMGVAADCMRQWSVRRFMRGEIRKAIRLEIAHIGTTINHYVLAAIKNDEDQEALAASYFSGSLRLEVVDYYWNHRREELLKLTEWSILKDRCDAFSD